MPGVRSPSQLYACTHCVYPRRDGQAELTWVAGLRSRRSPIPALTGLDVEQPCWSRPARSRYARPPPMAVVGLWKLNKSRIFVCCFGGVDNQFIADSANRITVDIALSTVIAGIALTSLVLLLILWKRDDNIKRHAYSFCEWISLVWQIYSKCFFSIASNTNPFSQQWNSLLCSSLALLFRYLETSNCYLNTQILARYLNISEKILKYWDPHLWNINII